MEHKSLEDAFVDEMRDALSAEKQLTRALGKMAKHATDADLKHAFASHLEETSGHVDRLERAFVSIGRTARAKKCEAMEGLLEEGDDVIEEGGEPEVIDALLIAAAQKVEHYEIATYGTLAVWAETLGFDHAADLIKQNLGEEKAADEKLTQIAEGSVNSSAAAAKQ